MTATPHNEPARAHVHIRGRVHGVGFRFAAREEAVRLALTGWVRNTADGVELLAEGPRDRLQRLVAWAHHGPSGALVTDVTESWTAAIGEYAGFDIRR